MDKNSELKKAYEWMDKHLKGEREAIYNLMYSEISSIGVAIARGDLKKLSDYYDGKLKQDLEKKKSSTSDSKNIQQQRNDSAKEVRNAVLGYIFEDKNLDKKKAMSDIVLLKKVILCFDNGKKRKEGDTNGDE